MYIYNSYVSFTVVEVMRLVRTDGGMMSSEVGQSDVLKMEEVDHDKRHCDVLPKQKKRGRLPEVLI